jgi:hypothetical protein
MQKCDKCGELLDERCFLIEDKYKYCAECTASYIEEEMGIEYE